MKPRLFIGSSAESLDTAYAIQENLEHDAEVTVWPQGVFELSKYTMDALIDQLEEADFCVFVFSPDDIALIRNEEVRTVRDNVVFELGLSVGRIGKERSFIVHPRGFEDLHLPTDLLGITPGTYESDRKDGNLVAALGPASNKVRKQMRRMGLKEECAGTSIPESKEPEMDENDALSIVSGWLGKQPVGDEGAEEIFKFSEIARETQVPAMLVEKVFEEAIQKYDFMELVRKGKSTIVYRILHE